MCVKVENSPLLGWLSRAKSGRKLSKLTGITIRSASKIADLKQRLNVAERMLADGRVRDARLRDLDEKIVRPEGPNIVSIPRTEFGDAALRLWSLLRPMRATGKPLVRKGQQCDGGYIMLDHGLNNAVGYSLGINQDVSWDFDMAALGCTLFQYDHTIDALPIEHSNFNWKKLGIAAVANVEEDMVTLEDELVANGHAENTNIILKMDIEDAEWDVLSAVSAKSLAQFSQIVMEIHKLCTSDYEHPTRDVNTMVKRAEILEKLNRTHQCIHVHANNYGTLGIVGGVLLPDVMEITYVRRADHTFETSECAYPTSLDMPCRKEAPDFFLGTIGLLPEYRLYNPPG